MLGGAKGLVAGIRKLAGCLVDDTACVSFNGLSAECARRSIDNRKYRALGRDYICVTVHSVCRYVPRIFMPRYVSSMFMPVHPWRVPSMLVCMTHTLPSTHV